MRLADGTMVWSLAAKNSRNESRSWSAVIGLVTHPSLPRPVPCGSVGNSTDAASPTVDTDVHEFISFEDPEEQRTWEFDATFLRSNYKCIYGEGCKGVLDAPAEELQQGCCSYGAHLIDDDDVQIVVRAFVRVKPEQMQFHAKAVRGGFMRPGEPDSDGATDHHHAPRRRCLHLLEPARVRGRRRLRAAHRRARGRRTPTRLEAERVLAGADPARAPHRRQRPRHVTPARVEAPRLGRRRQRLPLVVHRVAGGLRRSRAASTSRAATRSASSSEPTSTTSWWTSSSGPSGPRSPTPPSAADGSPARTSSRPTPVLSGSARGT